MYNIGSICDQQQFMNREPASKSLCLHKCSWTRACSLLHDDAKRPAKLSYAVYKPSPLVMRLCVYGETLYRACVCSRMLPFSLWHIAS